MAANVDDSSSLKILGLNISGLRKKTHNLSLLMIYYYIKVTMFKGKRRQKAYSFYSSQCRKLKISMSNGCKFPHVMMYFMCL